MKHLLYLFFFLCLLVLSATVKAEDGHSDPMFSDSYLSGRELSKQLNKPLLVYFFDTENAGCKSVDKLWEKKSILDIITTEFICTRVNIHYFDGETLQKYHKIDEAPAIILLSPTGETMRRITSVVNESELRSFLSNEPLETISVQNKKESQGRNDGSLSIVSVQDNEQGSITSSSHPIKESTAIGASPLEAYTIQIGAYGNEQNASQRVEELKRLFNVPVYYVEDSNSTNTLYRVVVGEFQDLGDTQNYLLVVRKYGIEGFIKSLPL